MNEHSKPTQNERVIKYIKDFGGITQLEAIKDIGVMRLASRICDLRKQGMPITSQYVKVKNRYNETIKIKRYSFSEVRE